MNYEFLIMNYEILIMNYFIGAKVLQFMAYRL